MSDFVIHALSLGDGILAITPLPGRNGNYAADLEHVREWVPSLVLSMTTSEEMEQAGAAGFGNDLRTSGTRWAHLPIDDFGTPSAEIRAKWPDIRDAALAALGGGGRVLIHCRGGCGRSGMAALRLMVESGEEPLDALTRLRKVRPCAVETEAQLAWAKRGRSAAQ